MKRVFEIGPIFIIIAALLWSFDGILRVSLYTLPPSIIIFWEHIIGALLIFPFVAKELYQLKQLSKKEWISIILVSLFSGVLGTILYTSALMKINYIQFSVVVLLQQLQPIWTISTAALLLKEKINANFLRWAILALVASYFVTFKDLRINLETGSQTYIAGAFALLAGMLWGSSTAFSKIVLKQVSFKIATFLRFVFAPFFAFFIIVLFNQQTNLFAVNQPQIMTLFIIALSTGLVALLIYYFGLRNTPAKVSTICELVWPASAIFIDYFYFKNSLSLTQIAGVIVLLYSIYKISFIKK